MAREFQEIQGFETKSIHTADPRSEVFGSLTVPLYMTSTYVFPNAETGGARFAGEEPGMIYSRIANPTVEVLEKAMAELEGAEAGLAFGSGMGAISAVLIAMIKSGDHILCSDGLYGCTYGLLTMLKEKFGVQFDLVDMADMERVRAAMRPETKVVYVETPINPTLKVVDLQAVADIAHAGGAQLVVDNTFMTPYLQQPLQHGADVVVHSATKYLGGHGDLIAGVAVGRKAFLDELRFSTLKDIGAVMAPMEAWLILRGIKTLSLRMERHCENAKKVAEFLHQHPKVTNVYFPGDENHPQKDLIARQMRGSGGMIAFEVETLEGGRTLMNSVRLAQLAVSLGEATTLIQHPASMTHAVVPADVRRDEMGIADGLVRLSVGLEHPQDIIADLEQALAKISEPVATGSDKGKGPHSAA
ncbi:methionine gamma-lyase [Tumebacillus flagellatus]|uniref:L-methionine gamma-lyase n=1 Tax=Tumebacillus flagellatus TaxID=1157490 RepID=A0A074LXH1_9BACL|nr:methionine gamma-lyase [Tumebacillus flagellatus]KEO85110.1 methionine gamma-lyase [Tumebacillus flagellatus]